MASEKMRPAEAAAYLKISQSKLAKLRMAGDGPRFAKVDRVVVYDQTDVNEWLESVKQRSTKA